MLRLTNRQTYYIKWSQRGKTLYIPYIDKTGSLLYWPSSECDFLAQQVWKISKGINTYILTNIHLRGKKTILFVFYFKVSILTYAVIAVLEEITGWSNCRFWKSYLSSNVDCFVLLKVSVICFFTTIYFLNPANNSCHTAVIILIQLRQLLYKVKFTAIWWTVLFHLYTLTHTFAFKCQLFIFLILFLLFQLTKSRSNL